MCASSRLYWIHAQSSERDGPPASSRVHTPFLEAIHMLRSNEDTANWFNFLKRLRQELHAVGVEVQEEEFNDAVCRAGKDTCAPFGSQTPPPLGNKKAKFETVDMDMADLAGGDTLRTVDPSQSLDLPNSCDQKSLLDSKLASGAWKKVVATSTRENSGQYAHLPSRSYTYEFIVDGTESTFKHKDIIKALGFKHFSNNDRAGWVPFTLPGGAKGFGRDTIQQEA